MFYSRIYYVINKLIWKIQLDPIHNDKMTECFTSESALPFNYESIKERPIVWNYTLAFHSQRNVYDTCFEVSPIVSMCRGP